ncbi:MAG: 50S ribosomal protein L11 methyltransferase, partial [Clostridia bacterium]
ICDEGDFHAFLEENRTAWDYLDDALLVEMAKPTCIKIYISDNAAGADTLLAVRDRLSALKNDPIFGALEISTNGMREEDWAENWKQYFHPLKVGKRILIQPEWESASDTEGRVVFTVNPGMSFGTGSHHTTRLCIEALETHMAPAARVLDLGCGSGILSIIALLLGAKYAEAIDIDPNAADIAVRNARQNGLSEDVFHAHAGNILTDAALRKRFSDEKFDLVLANIVADVIIPLSEFAGDFLAPGGVFITSGIINSRAHEVESALLQRFDILSRCEANDWVAMVCTPKNAL